MIVVVVVVVVTVLLVFLLPRLILLLLPSWVGLVGIGVRILDLKFNSDNNFNPKPSTEQQTSPSHHNTAF